MDGLTKEKGLAIALVESITPSVAASQGYAHRRVLSALYRTHGALVLRRARQITGSDEEAEDVLQELFHNLVEKPESLSRASNCTAWLYGATTHLCFNRIRNRKNRERLLQAHGADKATHRDASAETLAFVQQALGALPDAQAMAFVYYYLDQMTHAEIADVMGCSRRHVGNLLERARAELERIHREDADE